MNIGSIIEVGDISQSGPMQVDAGNRETFVQVVGDQRNEVKALHGQTSYGALFEMLRAAPETTRTELVQMTGLSKATVSEAVALMMERGMLIEAGKRRTNRGRSQVVLAFQPEVRLVIGAQFTERGCHVVLADLHARPIAWAERANSATDPAGFVDALVSCVQELRGKATAPILGLGVGVPGLVDPSGREVVLSVPYGWEHVPICDMLEAQLDMPVIATNRAKAAALGEYWQGDQDHGRARPEHLAYINIGAGIVAGFVNHGKLYTGSDGSAGELGHTTVLPDGPPASVAITAVCTCLHLNPPCFARSGRRRGRQLIPISPKRCRCNCWPH